MRQTRTMNVSLTPEIHAFVNRVTSGRFQTAREVIRAALRLLEEDERRQETNKDHPDGR